MLMDFDRSKWALFGPVGRSLDIGTQGHAGHRSSENRAIAVAYVRCNLVAAMPKLSLNSLPRSKFSEAFCHVVRAFGIHPQFV
jgi:hypothetical protein